MAKHDFKTQFTENIKLLAANLHGSPLSCVRGLPQSYKQVSALGPSRHTAATNEYA